MASIIFFILLTLFSTIHARESQFFNKFSNNNIPKESETLNTNQVPNFIPQSQESGDSYGLYGHESGQLPPSATNNRLPANLPENYNPVAYTTPIHGTTQDIPNEYKESQPQAYQYNSESKMYNSEKQGFDDSRFMETEEDGDMYKSQQQGRNGRYNKDDEMYNSRMQGMAETKYGTTNNGDVYNPEKQGMSDTRFLENGKYYYDLNMEKRNPNVHMNRGFSSRNEYNTQGYNGNNENSYDRYNSNGGYENQEEFQVDQFNP